jgi:hypothetical protein
VRASEAPKTSPKMEWEMFMIRRKERDARSAGRPAFSIAHTVHSANQLEPSVPARKSAATILTAMSVRKHPQITR